MMKLQVVTISVSSLEKARRFYVNVLGFEPDIYYEPTRWQSFKCEGNGGFGIVEVPGLVRNKSYDIINFTVNDVVSLWQKVREVVSVETPLGVTPYGTHKFVIRDPDGFRLGFVGKNPAEGSDQD